MYKYYTITFSRIIAYSVRVLIKERASFRLLELNVSSAAAVTRGAGVRDQGATPGGRSSPQSILR